ncbi:hypothetical protein H6F74_26875 [Trichocoleus sp. FACHB-90]|uniref:hypothetical protein n=1 Tax=Cyanophyceae TaxID=3028117 RepID=UPI00168514F6|nr:hypothetical protein [Trichocoleus sp. FACHB-90]MBD1929830.1 hypothetical protein [Trichocoleus sp. FACHB-90]
MSRDSDQLLYVISAKKEMPWVSFKEVFNYLYTLKVAPAAGDLNGINYKRFQTVRALDALGHCDFDFSEEGNKVYAAPPVLVRLPCAGFPQAILAGARSPQSIHKLSEACKVIGSHINLHVSEQPNELVFVPVRVAVQAESTEELVMLADSLGISFDKQPGAWSLLHFAASLDDYLATRQWVARPELNLKRKDFDSTSLQFREPQNAATGIRLSKYTNPVRNVPVQFLWKDSLCTQIDGDWGRYVVLKLTGLSVLVYDERRFTMAVPASVPLPRLFERALVLCSGYAATFVPTKSMPRLNQKTSGFNLFRDIPPQIAEMTAARLGQSLLLQSLDINF